MTAQVSSATAATFRTDWGAIFSSTLIPLTVAAGFAWFAFEPADFDDWAFGLLALIPLEYFRAIVLSILRDTYREYRTPAQATRFFLVSLGILVGLLLAWSVYAMKGDWWAWISKPDVYRAIGVAVGLVAIDGVIGVAFFNGDPRVVAARLDAIAADIGDWVQLAGVQLPVVLALGYGAALIAREKSAEFAWVPDPTSATTRSAALLYAAFYFAGKAALVAHAYGASFTRTGERVLGGRWVQWVTWEKNKDVDGAMKREDEARHRRRAILGGDADGAA